VLMIDVTRRQVCLAKPKLTEIKLVSGQIGWIITT